MENHPDHEYQRIHLLRAIRHAQIDPGELWLHYFGLAGDAGEYEVEAYLHGSFTLPPLQRDLLAHAANELIDRLPAPPRAPYSTDLVDDGGTDGHPADDGGTDSHPADDGGTDSHPADDGSVSVASPGEPGGTSLDWLLGTRAGGASAPNGTGSGGGSTGTSGTSGTDDTVDGRDSTGAERPTTHLPDGPDSPGGPESGAGTS
ncbi:hypothetical protein [Arthrobacter sp. MDT1-65]